MATSRAEPIQIQTVVPEGVRYSQGGERGFYCFTHGDFDITVLTDGSISIPAETLVVDVAADLRATVLRNIGAVEGSLTIAANVPLIRVGGELILVDIGGGHRYQSTDGKLASSLYSAGIDPVAVTKVVFTHAHPDHIWATITQGGQLRFPNATYYVGEVEWDFWMDPDYLTAMPHVLHDFARGAQRDLGAVANRVVMLKSGDDVVNGFKALGTPGHTPGHLSFELAGREDLIITADAATNQTISFAHPEWRFGYDTLPEIAVATRLRLLDRAATDRAMLLGYHWNYPGVGFAERSGAGFSFTSAS